jgi:hypothetical protein
MDGNLYQCRVVETATRNCVGIPIPASPLHPHHCSGSNPNYSTYTCQDESAELLISREQEKGSDRPASQATARAVLSP